MPHRLPGVWFEEVAPLPAATLLTGVPLFLGYAGKGRANEIVGPAALTSWPAFRDTFGTGPDDGYLAAAVEGFFVGGGRLCYAVGFDLSTDLTALEALRGGLAAAHDLDVDIVCAPDIVRASVLGSTDPVDAAARLQAEVLADCRRVGGRFALLDTVAGADPATVRRHRARLSVAVSRIGGTGVEDPDSTDSTDSTDSIDSAERVDGVDGADGALYHPWPTVPGSGTVLQDVPPCGHVAAVYALTDAAVGVHRAPANVELDGVIDLADHLTDDDAADLTDAGVNCLLARTGRGIRVWGARTLSDDPARNHVGARRVLLTAARWVERFLDGTVFEPDDLRLRMRVSRELEGYLEGLRRQGALRGNTSAEAYYVRCDPEPARFPPGGGVLVVDVGLALTVPAEFVVLRVVRGASGVTASPSAAG